MRKFGLVLGGGGAKGAYEMGVWRALRELGIKPEVVAGTSIGALNGALVVQGEYERAVQLWRGVKYETVLSAATEEDLTTPAGTVRALKTALREIVRDGGMDITPLEQLVRETIDEGRIRRSPIEFGMVTVSLPSLKTVTLAKHEIDEGEMADYLLASAAIYPAFRRRDIGGTRYIDGGFRNNLPIDLAIALGAQDILAVDLDAAGVVPRGQGKGADAQITVLKSYWGLGNMLDFEQGQISANMELGYLETMKLYGKYEGFAYTFNRGQSDEWRDSWVPQYERLLERIGMGPADGVSPAERFATWRISRLLEDAKRVGRPVEQPELRMPELAAEMLGVPYTEVYTVRSMGRAILAACAEEADIALADFGELFTNPAYVAELAKKLSLMERRQVLSLICRWLDGYIHGDGRGGNFALLAGAAPAEFAAACTIYIIKNSDINDIGDSDNTRKISDAV